MRVHPMKGENIDATLKFIEVRFRLFSKQRSKNWSCKTKIMGSIVPTDIGDRDEDIKIS